MAAVKQQNVEGGDLMLFVEIENTKYTLAFATSHKLSINAETVENSSKDNGGGKWSSKTAKKLSWSLSSENLFLEKGDEDGMKQKAFGDIFDLMVERKPVKVVFAPAKEAVADKDANEIPEAGWTAEATGTYTGEVIITSLEANAPNGDNATFSVSMEGVGALTHVSGTLPSAPAK